MNVAINNLVLLCWRDFNFNVNACKHCTSISNWEPAVKETCVFVSPLLIIVLISLVVIFSFLKKSH